MSNTVITNYTDLNGPSTKADSSVVVIVNKDGTLSVDQNLLGTLMGTDGSQSSGISVVRVGHEGRPDDATDSENEDDKIPHVTLTVDSYYNEPNSIIKYDSGAEMLQSLRIETRENSLVGFHNDHCYTALTSPSQVVSLPQRERSENFASYNEPVIQISHTPPPKPVPNSKKITILEQKIIPKGKKIQIKPTDSPVVIKGKDVLNKPLQALMKGSDLHETDKIADSLKKLEESTESSSLSSSGDSIADRDSDSDYKDQKVVSIKPRKAKVKPRILKSLQSTKASRLDNKSTPKLKPQKSVRREVKDVRTPQKVVEKKQEQEIDLESLLPSSKISVSTAGNIEFNKTVLKQTPKPVKKEKKTPAHVTALLSDMTSLFSTPDVIRRVSTDNKPPSKAEKESPSEPPSTTKLTLVKNQDPNEGKTIDNNRMIEVNRGKVTRMIVPVKKDSAVLSPADKTKGCDLIPQIDDASLAQILQDTVGIGTTSPLKAHPIVHNAMNSPGLAGPMSPTLDLGLQPTGLEDGLTEDLLLHVAHLVQNSDKLQEVIDTQVLNVEAPAKAPIQSPFQQAYSQTLVKSAQKTVQPKEKPIQIVKSDGRVITLPPIEAPATRSSKRKSQMETTPVTTTEVVQAPMTFSPPEPEPAILESQVIPVSKQYVNKKLPIKKQELQPIETPILDKISAESQESWNSEDDPFRLWCICKQPHNNRFMICCDGCEDWFHGKCVNITKAMGQQMEDQGIEWRCPNCIKKTKSNAKSANKTLTAQKQESPGSPMGQLKSPLPRENPSKTNCIVCKKSARASSIYCSDACILKHAQDSLGNQSTPTKLGGEAGKSQDKFKSDSSRVIVYERKSGRLLAGPNAPTAGELKSWLQKNPTFEVVRPGALSSIRPGKKKLEAKKIQTTLNFERLPKNTPETLESPSPVRIPQSDVKDRRLLLSRRENLTPSPKPATPRSNQIQLIDTPRPSTSTAKPVSEPRKLVRNSLNKSTSNEKPPSASPSISRKKDTPTSETKPKMNSTEPIRDNVRKSLQEQMSIRMKENKGAKFSEDEIQQFAVDTEVELHDLFKDVGTKYKAKYRSLIFNIKDRKNLSLWQKICDKSITPQQLARLTPDEMASQELSEWRDQESKYQLELIKKSELDLLAANKTYVLKTHKGEEVMETKESVSTELDPNVPIEDVVIALNDSTLGEAVTREVVGEVAKPKSEENKESKSKKRDSDEVTSSRSKKSRRNSSPAGRRKSRRDSDRKSRSSRRKSEYREKDSKSERRSTRRTEKKPRTRSISRDRSKRDSKEKSDSERSRHRSRSKEKSKRSKSREKSRSASKGRERERSRSRGRARRRSDSKDVGKRRHRSRSKHASGDEKSKLRSRSQDNNYSKNKTDSTDSDSIERPKSASLKDPHPEYDPHEPMITSAFSEEDLRKTEDAFEDTYKSEILDSGIEYDPTKMFTLDSSILPSTTFVKQDKPAETESDQEPTSTVENAAAVIWNGCINMVDVARFYVSAHEVSGSALDLEEELCAELDIVGRINPETVWEYIHKTKKGTNKDVDLLKLQAANDEEKMQYIALYSYLSSRNRLGVVKVPNSTSIKDFYIIPLPAKTSLPDVLLPLNGPGLGDVKTHLLIAVIVRQRRKRSAPNIPKDIVPAKVVRESRKRSYTPPVVSKSSYTPPVVSKSSYTPPTSPRRRALPLPTYPASSLSTSVKDKIAASLACADDGDEAYSPGGSSNNSNSAPPAPAVIAPPAPPAANVLRTKMEELNRQIEEQKQQIMKMAQADSSVGAEGEEAYSPSRPMTPPTPVPPAVSTLADIALPSNLQEILATIKQRSENQSTVDMRNLPLP